MARNFTITTPAETVRVGAGNRGEMVFTVTNVSGVPKRGMGKIVPLGETKAEWLALTGELEREFAQGGVQPFTVAANVPAGTPPARYSWRFDVVTAAKSGEEHEAGPVVAFEVPATEAPKKSMAWLWIAIAAAVLVLVAVVFLLTRGPKLVEVPNVVGTTQTQAEATLKAAGFVPKAKRVLTGGPVLSVPIVRDQDPDAGQQAEEGSTVTIMIPGRRFVPPLKTPTKPIVVKQP
jgi:hypothetical protein